jgi:hypothetical protein
MSAINRCYLNKIAKKVSLLIFVIVTFFCTLAFETNPLLGEGGKLTPRGLREARTILVDLLPLADNESQEGTILLSSQASSQAIGYGLSHWRGGYSSIDYAEGSAQVLVTANLPLNLYLNIQLKLTKTIETFAIDKLKIGKVPISVNVANYLLRLANSVALKNNEDYKMLQSALTDFAFLPAGLELHYNLAAGFMQKLGPRGFKLLFSESQFNLLANYFANLLQIEASQSGKGSLGLTKVLTPLMAQAIKSRHPAAESNRLIFTALALHQLRLNPEILGLQTDKRPERRFTLYSRRDFAEHFIGSALLASSLSPSLSDTLGLLKERDDAETGSGFSFTDLAADRVGTEFARVALTNDSSARLAQELLASSQDESLFMFDARDLPEYLSEQQFIELYSSTESEAYKTVEAKIDARLATLPLMNIDY